MFVFQGQRNRTGILQAQEFSYVYKRRWQILLTSSKCIFPVVTRPELRPWCLSCQFGDSCALQGCLTVLFPTRSGWSSEWQMYDEEMSSLNGRQSRKTVSQQKRCCKEDLTAEAGSAVIIPHANKNSGGAQYEPI